MKKKTNFQAPTSKQIKVRTVVISVLFTLIFGLATARAFQLHLGQHHKLQRLAQRQYQKRIVLAPKRGNILDRNGEPLALDLQVDSVYATPHRLEKPKALAKKLSKILGVSYQEILPRLSKADKKFVWIKRRISPKESKKIKEAKLEGIGLVPEYKRFYPNNQLAANLIGAVGMDAKALAGLELSYDKTLKSEAPPLLIEQDAKGRAYNPYALVGREHPKQLILTIDKTIQYIAEQALEKTMESSQAKGGVAIVLHVKTGEILAMASAPSFDPNHYQKYAFKNWRNRTVSDAFEPGSTFKAITAALTLKHQVLNTKQKLHCENGSMKVGKYEINDHHGYGLLDLGDILKYSSNICSFKLAQKIGKERFVQGLKDFGFGKSTPLEIPGEQSGFLASAKHLSKIQLGTMGFGQGVSATPLQIAMAYGALANGGKLMKPLIVKEIRDDKGHSLEKFSPEEVRQAVSPEHAQSVIQLLKRVVEKGGTGTQANLPDYTVAGKTGTAQKVDPGKRGYAKNKYVASFVGLAPAEDPELVVLVSVDEPKGSYYGGAVSAPVFQKIMGQSLAYLNIPPSLNKRLAQQEVKAKPIRLPPPQAKMAATSAKANQKSPKQTSNKPKTMAAHEESESSIPDFTGLSVREVLRKAQAESLQVNIKGSGICQSQEPNAGERLSEGSVISVTCQAPNG